MCTSRIAEQQPAHQRERRAVELSVREAERHQAAGPPPDGRKNRPGAQHAGASEHRRDCHAVTTAATIEILPLATASRSPPLTIHVGPAGKRRIRVALVLPRGLLDQSGRGSRAPRTPRARRGSARRALGRSRRCRWRPPGRRRRPRPGRAPRPPASARRPAPADVFERQCPEPVTAVREPVKACADHPVASILVDSPSPAPTPARRLTPAVNDGNI